MDKAWKTPTAGLRKEGREIPVRKNFPYWNAERRKENRVSGKSVTINSDPYRRERRKNREICEGKTAENLSTLTINIKLQIQETRRTQSRIKCQENYTQHTIFKLRKKIKDNEKNLERNQMVKRSYLQRRKELYSTSQTSRKQGSWEGKKKPTNLIFCTLQYYSS